MNQIHTLRLILADQLNHFHSWFDEPSEGVLYFMCEQRSETDYVRHHIQKVAAFFQAMREFCAEKQAQGFQFLYYRLDNPANKPTFAENIADLVQTYQVSGFEYQQPDEYRLAQELEKCCAQLTQNQRISCKKVDTEHFLSSPSQFQRLFEGKKSYLMESFYRHIRRQYGLLMEADGKTPLTGVWNYDQHNRKPLPKTEQPPPIKRFSKDVTEIIQLLAQEQVQTIGSIARNQVDFATNRAEALQLLAHFIGSQLPKFGDYEDAMAAAHRLIYHSQLSFCLNVKLLHPLELVKAVEKAHLDNPQRVSIAQAEGFIRQIIGWREYVRGIYWVEMPKFAQLNHFNHQNPLPDWFWDAKTGMNCVRNCLKNTLENAYAHHIQRLMVIGNIALLLNCDPEQVDSWYLGVYADAIEWVQLPNTRGMSQFADGGIVGTKPYIAAAAYINKMSDYCQGCQYNPKLRHGAKACPFNSLYWFFYMEKEPLLRKNPRVAVMYAQLDKMSEEEKAAIRAQAQFYINNNQKL